MPNDKDWEKRSTEWVNMSHKSKQRKEALGKSEEQGETREHERKQPSKQAPHEAAVPPTAGKH